MLAHGREHFTGWLGTRYGTFYTTYTYTARFDGAVELHGRCHHPITGGNGDFAGIRGELSFTDVVDQEPFSYPYWGNIQLDRGTPVILARDAALAREARAPQGSPRPPPHPASRRLARLDARCHPAYLRRYAAGVIPVVRRNRRRKNVGSS